MRREGAKSSDRMAPGTLGYSSGEWQIAPGSPPSMGIVVIGVVACLFDGLMRRVERAAMPGKGCM
jgi:hypothetical protein